MMGLIQGTPTKKDAELAAEATRESWQALLDRLGMLVQGRSLPERQSLRNDALGAIHVHMSRRSYENRVNWQIERDEFLAALNDPKADPAAIVAKLRAMITKPAAPSEPIPPLSPKPAPAPEPAPPKRAPFGPLPETERDPDATWIEVESRTPGYGHHQVRGRWSGKSDEAIVLINQDMQKQYPFGGREVRINADGTFSYVGHTD